MAGELMVVPVVDFIVTSLLADGISALSPLLFSDAFKRRPLECFRFGDDNDDDDGDDLGYADENDRIGTKDSTTANIATKQQTKMGKRLLRVIFMSIQRKTS